MTGRAQAILFGPIAFMLVAHAAGLVLADRSPPTAFPKAATLWGAWNLLAPAILAAAGGMAVRKSAEQEPPHSSPPARITWSVAALDLVLTGVLALVLWGVIPFP